MVTFVSARLRTKEGITFIVSTEVQTGQSFRLQGNAPNPQYQFPDKTTRNRPAKKTADTCLTSLDMSEE